MKQSRDTIVEPVGIPDSLSHCLRYVQPLHPLDLDMYPRKAHKVRHFTKGQRPAPLDVIAVPSQDTGKLPLAIGSFALR